MAVTSADWGWPARRGNTALQLDMIDRGLATCRRVKLDAPRGSWRWYQAMHAIDRLLDDRLALTGAPRCR
jgi:hypothetical protein